jgi:hypothetical protein
MTCEVTGDAPAVQKTYGLLRKGWEYVNQVQRVGEKVEPWLWQTGLFSEVNVHGIRLPFGNRSSAAAEAAQNSAQQEKQAVDPKAKVRALAGVIMESTRRGFAEAKQDPGMAALGFTPELKSQFVEQFSTAEWQMDMPLYFVSAQKSV